MAIIHHNAGCLQDFASLSSCGKFPKKTCTAGLSFTLFASSFTASISSLNVVVIEIRVIICSCHNDFLLSGKTARTCRLRNVTRRNRSSAEMFQDRCNSCHQCYQCHHRRNVPRQVNVLSLSAWIVRIILHVSLNVTIFDKIAMWHFPDNKSQSHWKIKPA